VTAPTSAWRKGGAGASVATGAPAMPAKPGLPLRSQVRTKVVDAGHGIEADTANEEDTGTAKGVRGNTLPQVAQPKRLLAAGAIDADAIKHAVAAGAALNVEEARAIVVAARARVRADEDARRARMDTSPSERTLNDYRKKSARVDAAVRASDKSPDDALRAAMAKYAGARQTFQAMKSAVRTLTLSHMRFLLSEQDKVQRARGTVDEGKWKARWLGMVSMLRWTLSDLQVIDDLKRDECLRASKMASRPSKSKRKLVPLFDAGWRERFLQLNDRSTTYKEAGVILRFAGVRPEELERGVRVWWSPKGIRVLVAGAKVRDTAGQPWRCFLLDPSALPKWFVERVQKGHKLEIRAKADAMRTHLGRQSQPVLNPTDKKRGQGWRLSAYVFRHALVSDMRASGWTPEDIAPVIGEGSAATANMYGSAHTAGTVSPAVIAGSIRVPRAVKPLDRSGLASLAHHSHGAKTAGKPKQRRR
jgi:hypothetical protein